MRRHQGRFQTVLYCKKLECDVEIEVEYYYTPGSPGDWYQPPDASEIEILSVVPISENPEEQDIEIDDFDMEQLTEDAFDYVENS